MLSSDDTVDAVRSEIKTLFEDFSYAYLQVLILGAAWFDYKA